MMNNSCPSNLEVHGVVKPRAMYNQVCSNVNPKTYDKKEFLAVIGATNDLATKKTNELVKSTNLMIKSLSTTNVIVCTLLYRHDKDVKDTIHNTIIVINDMIMNVTS